MTAAVFELDALPPPPGGQPGIRVVQVRGEVDVTNAAQLQEALADLAAVGLVADLSGVGYFDSAGFAVLDRLLARHPIAVVVPPGAVIRTAMTLMHLPFHDTIDAAQAALYPS
jgi:anti-sigma B factor antagonist